MAIDYTALTKKDLIDMLMLRDASTDDLKVMDIKIEKLTAHKTKLLMRRQELASMVNNLSEDEKQDVLAGLQNRINKTDAELVALTDLKTKLTEPEAIL